MFSVSIIHSFPKERPELGQVGKGLCTRNFSSVRRYKIHKAFKGSFFSAGSLIWRDVENVVFLNQDSILSERASPCLHELYN